LGNNVTYFELEDDMEALAGLGQFFLGIGMIMLASAAFWFVSEYAEKKKK